MNFLLISRNGLIQQLVSSLVEESDQGFHSRFANFGLIESSALCNFLAEISLKVIEKGAFSPKPSSPAASVFWGL